MKRKWEKDVYLHPDYEYFVSNSRSGAYPESIMCCYTDHVICSAWKSNTPEDNGLFSILLPNMLEFIMVYLTTLDGRKIHDAFHDLITDNIEHYADMPLPVTVPAICILLIPDEHAEIYTAACMDHQIYHYHLRQLFYARAKGAPYMEEHKRYFFDYFDEFTSQSLRSKEWILDWCQNYLYRATTPLVKQLKDDRILNR